MKQKLIDAIALAETRYAQARNNARVAEGAITTTQAKAYQIRAAIDACGDIAERKRLREELELAECFVVNAVNEAHVMGKELQTAQNELHKAQKALVDYDAEVQSLEYRLNVICHDHRTHEEALNNARQDVQRAEKRLSQAKGERDAIERRLALLTADELEPAQAA